LPGPTASPLADGRRDLRPGPGRTAGAGELRRSQPMPTDRLLRRSGTSGRAEQGGPMSTPMTPEQEHEFYADAANQVPQGPPVRRRRRLGEPVPVRFPEDLLEQVRQRAVADDR